MDIHMDVEETRTEFPTENPPGRPGRHPGHCRKLQGMHRPQQGQRVRRCVPRRERQALDPAVGEGGRKAHDGRRIQNQGVRERIAGDAAYVAEAIKFAYGQEQDLSALAAVQTLSGTVACRIRGQFLSNLAPVKTIYVPDPTWGNHIAIFENCGLEVMRYRYYNWATNGLDLDGMVEDLKAAPTGAIVLLHACTYNTIN